MKKQLPVLNKCYFSAAAQTGSEEAPPDPGQHGGRGHREDAGAEEDLLQDQLRRPEGPGSPARQQPAPPGPVPQEGAGARQDRRTTA